MASKKKADIPRSPPPSGENATGEPESVEASLSESQSPSFPIVGIGASAGGLEALTELFQGLPANTGMAFVVVQHLAPTHESMLAEILSRSTKMPVMQVHDEPAVLVNHVYVIPPGRDMVIQNRALGLTPRVKTKGMYQPIDHFFRSLAEDQGHSAIGVVLSGGATDGTLGLGEIKSAGGITFAQDQSAKHESMPSSAIASGAVDFVRSPKEIANELARIAQHPHAASQPVIQLEKAPDEPSISGIVRMLRDHTGVDFSRYKASTLYRRITRRMVLHKMEGIDDYLNLLRRNRDEIEELYYDVLINVTNFFRNPEMFELLKTKIFPRLTRERSGQDPVRIWVLGCSTGEEAYSIAMAYTEYAESTGTRVSAQIFATDLNARGIDKARNGVYGTSIAQDVTPERLRRFFTEVDGSFRIHKAIRDMCVFARHNVLTDPPFSHIDLVSCRNLLIYLEPVLQQRALSTMHYALRPHGILWLGHSETIGPHRNLFEPEDAASRFYSKKPATLHLNVPTTARRTEPALAGQNAATHRDNWPGSGDILREADRVLLAKFVPPAVLIDAEMDIIQIRGDTSRYLSPAPGRASLNLLKMARNGLLVGLRSAIRRARKNEHAVREERIRVHFGNEIIEVSVEVMPIRGAAFPPGCLLVVFESTNGALEQAGSRNSRTAKMDEPPAPDVDESQVARLSHELAATREYLQSVIEQQEAVNEELQSANEEVQSSNEELQSINEELETSKEEIQSSNEELATVNDELRHRNEELTQTNNDLINLLGSVNMTIVMLGRDLRIRRFTPTAEKMLNLIATDVGRPITDIALHFDLPDLGQLLMETIDTVTVKELEVRDRRGRWFYLRLRPYLTIDNKIDGAVLVLVDIDSLKRAEVSLRESEERYRLTVEGAIGYAIFLLDEHGRVSVWNTGAQRLFGYSEAEVLGEPISRLYTQDEITAGLPREELRAAGDGTQVMEEGLRVRKDGSTFWAHTTTAALRDPAGNVTGYSKMFRDVSDRKSLEDDLRKRIDALAVADRSKNEFLAMLAHELRNPLATLRNSLEVMSADDKSRPDLFERAHEMMDRQVSTMTRFVEDLLDVSRISKGKIRFRADTVDLSAVTSRSVDTIESRLRARDQTVKLTLPQMPVFVRGDETRCEQMIGNLLNNAAKFSDNGAVIEVTLRTEPGATTIGTQGRGVSERLPLTVVVSVRDEGLGIDPDMLPRIFDPFVQADRSLARSHGGLGIGLTLVKSIAEAHGGHVEAQSEGVGHGSVFVLRLPAFTARGLGDATAAPSRPHSLSHGSATPRRIVVVDDNPDAVESLTMLLRVAGHDVETAHTGPEALDVVAAHNPDVVILDIGLPGLDGYQVAREIRQRPGNKETMLIALSGYGLEEDRRRAFQAGFNHHMTKPPDPSALEVLLEAAPPPRRLSPSGSFRRRDGRTTRP